VALLVLAVVVTGCRLDVRTELDIGADGAASIGVALVMDPTLVTELDVLGVDPTAELEAAVAVDPAWDVVRSAGDEGLTVRVQRDVATADAIGPALRSLAEGTGADDPRLELDLEVVRAADGRIELEGDAAWRTPARPVALLDDEPIGPDADELGDVVAAATDVTVTVTMPGNVTAHDASQVDGRTLTWTLPPDTVVSLQASSAPPAWWQVLPWWLLAGTVAGLLLGIVVVGWLLRRTRASGASPT
jgi:hypothetical protein